MRLRTLLGNHASAAAGFGALVVYVAALVLLPAGIREGLRETTFDLVLAADARWRKSDGALRTPPIIVVDIDRRSIDAVGAWPWPRETVAKLLDAVASAGPAAVAIDILFDGPDSRSPAALARRLGTVTARPDLTQLAETLPDGDKRLEAALRDRPVVLGFVLDPDQSEPLPGIPVLLRGKPSLDAVWRLPGAIAPPPQLLQAARGLGALPLPGDADGDVRHVPLLVAVGNRLHPGLAAEAVRLNQKVSAYLVEADPMRLTMGDRSIALGDDAMLRLAPPREDESAATTVSALDVVNGKHDALRLKDAIVLIGGSAPELGGLRSTSGDPLTPSVQIQARAVRQILDGRAPRPVATGAAIAAIIALSVLGIAAGTLVTPLVGTLVVLGAIVLTGLAAVGLSLSSDRLLDPLLPSFGAAFTFVAASIAGFARTRWREALVRQRFEQHLAPAVVSRIVADPSAVKLTGERREITALFTDVEGFTAMTQRAEPEQLVAILDRYFEEIAAIVIQHGGMVDKIIGDGMHALFNAPVDLADHPARAVACATAIRRWSRDFQQRGEPAALGFGRTRVGLETGMSVVGDVGIKAKLDYTAYGDVVNVAARLETANKELGSAICVGPAAAARCDQAALRPLGVIAVRGREQPLAVFEPWPETATAQARERYLAAFRTIDGDRQAAITMFEALAAEGPADAVPARMAQRLRAEG